MGPSPNAVLSDVHQIASGIDTTVAVLGVLSNRKSRVCIPDRRQPSAVDWRRRAERQHFACVGMHFRAYSGEPPELHVRRPNLGLDDLFRFVGKPLCVTLGGLIGCLGRF